MHPTSFRRELKKFDSQLDLEWNGRKSQWEVVGYDRKHLRYLIKVFPLGAVDSMGVHVLEDLYNFSPLKQGGAKELNRRLDRVREEEEAADERQLQNSIQDKLDEAWQQYQYAEGSRVSFAQPSVTDAGVLVKDKRRVLDVTPPGE
jgi:hypothetical protein